LKGFVRAASGDEETGRRPMPWVVTVQGRAGVTLAPVWPQFYAERLLFRNIPRVLLVSATLSEQTGGYLGIPRDEREYIEVGSSFDPKRAPLIYVPTTRVDRRMIEGQNRIWMNRLDGIIGDRLDRKGIIHTRSYSRAQEILRRSKHSDLMILPMGGKVIEGVEKFKRAQAPCILVSPSVEEGFDFPGELCRYQIIAKVPFVDTRDPLIQERVKMDKGYGNYLAAMSMVQMAGRGMRSTDDWCETFIVDDHWQWFQKAARFPDWFRRAWKWEARVPEPLGP
jgi:Rad3-related DNA helicase